MISKKRTARPDQSKVIVSKRPYMERVLTLDKFDAVVAAINASSASELRDIMKALKLRGKDMKRLQSEQRMFIDMAKMVARMIPVRWESNHE